MASTEHPTAADTLNGVDLLILGILCLTGMIFLWDSPAWAPNVYIGHDQFGDADFWWQGALEMAHGVFWDNINFTFRMGFAIFAGLLVALFGPNFVVFHKLLICFFLAIATAVYTVGVPRLGRLTAFALSAALVSSPMIAEHLAISTSDGLGLCFNLIAIIALWRGLTGPNHHRWIAIAGVFIALAALTRPLMVIFGVPALVLVFFVAGGSWRLRILRAIVFLFAMAVPILSWATLFYLKTGTFGLAGNDAGTFYAASDPAIQVWNPSMYAPVEEAARRRLGAQSVTSNQVDEEFRREAAGNYIKYARYHLLRLPGHLVAIAGFSFADSHPMSQWEGVSRIAIRGLLMLCLLAACWAERRWAAGITTIAVFTTTLWTTSGALVVIAAALLFALPFRWRCIGPLQRITAYYWWTGAGALFITGGTWGPTLVPNIAINALGYRLGAQFFFAGDWLIVMALVAVAGQPVAFENWFARRTKAIALLGDIDGARVLGGVTKVALSGSLILYIGGVSTFTARAWQRAHSVTVPMPAVGPMITTLCAQAGGGLRSAPPQAQSASVLYQMWGEAAPDKRLEGLRVFTGATGGLIWQMNEQNRTRAIFYQQDTSAPFEFNHFRSDLEFHGLLLESAWRKRVGAWLIRSFREVGPHAGYPYYETLPKVQMFVPLAADGKSFDVSQAVRFRLARYASLLAFSQELSPVNASLYWQKYPTSDTNRRWLILEPTEPTQERNSVTIAVSVEDAIGERQLSFSFRIEPVPGRRLGRNDISMAVQAVDGEGNVRVLLNRSSSAHGGAVDVPADHVSIGIPDDLSRVQIVFRGLSPEEMARVIELKLISNDVKPGIGGTFCTRR